MKTKNLLLLTIAAIGHYSVSAQGIAFENGDWTSVLKKASTSGKIIFVDFYATWCGPCKYMSANVFTDPQVGTYFNEHFVSFKVDAEREEEDLVTAIDLEAYPTLAFFDASGNLLYKHVGGLNSTDFIELGENIANYPSSREKSLNGTATYEEMLQYLSIAKNADPENFSRLAPALAGKLTAAELTDPNAWSIFTAQQADIHSPVFQEIVLQGGVLGMIHNDYVDYVSGVMTTYFTKVVESGKREDLLIYKKLLRDFYREVAQMDLDVRYFDLKVDADYYNQRDEMNDYARVLTEWTETYIMDDWEELSETAVRFSYLMEGAEYQERALRWATKARELEKNKHTTFMLAIVCKNGGKKDEAVRLAKETLTYELDDEERAMVNEYIAELES